MIDQETIDALDKLAGEWKAMYYAERAEALRLREIITSSLVASDPRVNPALALEILGKVRSGPHG